MKNNFSREFEGYGRLAWILVGIGAVFWGVVIGTIELAKHFNFYEIMNFILNIVGIILIGGLLVYVGCAMLWAIIAPIIRKLVKRNVGKEEV